jgi:O-acetyl-ADP-ribose deacetylase (regulator of RNase III)
MTDLPERIHLIDRDARLVAAWSEAFRAFPEVSATRGDFFAQRADAMVGPGNSFGIMDGGLDDAIRQTVGSDIEKRVRGALVAEHHGELHVGAAVLVETGDGRWPWLIYAPTMRVPDDVSRTTNAYVAFRAILLTARRHNLSNPERPIRSMVCSGLCTGVGAMPPRRCAAQMRIAYRQIHEPPDLPSTAAIYETHTTMRTLT